jgi:hypothetical protein
VTPLAARRGINVPAVAAVAATVNAWLFPVFVTDHVTPVAVPALEISAALSDVGLMASTNVSVKFMGTEFVDADWPAARTKLATVGGVES